MGWGELSTSWGERSLINVGKDTKDSGLEDLEDEKYKSFCKKTYQVINQVDEIGLPLQGEQLRLITFRSFNAAIFLAHITETEIIEEIILVVYSINAEAAKLINDLILTGKIKKAKVLMSNLRNKAHRVKEQITRDSFVNNPNVDLFFCSSHAKIISMKTDRGNYYTIEGSGNLSFNSRVEQYSIENNKALFDFNNNWTEKIKTYLSGKKELILT